MRSTATIADNRADASLEHRWMDSFPRLPFHHLHDAPWSAPFGLQKSTKTLGKLELPPTGK